MKVAVNGATENGAITGLVCPVGKSGLDLSTLAAWLVLPRGYTNWLWRLCGACGLIDGYHIYDWMMNRALPYVVPTWRCGSNFFILPEAPHSFLNPIFLVFFLACGAMVMGLRSKLVLLIPIATLAYFGCLELVVGAVHFTVLLFWFLVALLFDRPGLSLTRRLIQLCISFCYAFSVMQKLAAAPFLEGYALASHVAHGWFIDPFWLKVFARAHLSHEFFIGLSIAVILIEAFLCVALFPRKTRSLAVFVGIIFHGIMAAVMYWWIGVFTLVTWTSYFAFLEPKNEATAKVPGAGVADLALAERRFVSQHKMQVSVALALLVLWLCVPLRICWWPGRPTNSITILDRRPWTFAMFASEDFVKHIAASYTDGLGRKRRVPLVARMAEAQADNELYAMANYLFRTYKDAEKVDIETNVLQNSNNLIRKNVSASKVGQSIRIDPIKVSVFQFKDEAAESHG